jgi:hypothetical protein
MGTNMKKSSGLILGLMLAAFNGLASDPTALDLAKEGNRYVGEQSKDKIVQIRSDKTVGSLEPKVWYVVYRDETATLKTVEVKFVAGKMADVKRPLRLIEATMQKQEPLDRKKLKVDSDKAIKLATKESILENLKVTAVQAKLEEGEVGPVWRVKIWAGKVKAPNKEVDIGEIVLLAEDGKVIKNDIVLKRLD